MARSAWIASAVGSRPSRARATSARTSSPRRTLAGVAPQSVRNSAQVSSSTDTRATRAPHAGDDAARVGGHGLEDTEDHAGEVALERADGFGAGLAFGAAPSDVVTSPGVNAGLGE